MDKTSAEFISKSFSNFLKQTFPGNTQLEVNFYSSTPDLTPQKTVLSVVDLPCIIIINKKRETWYFVLRTTQYASIVYLRDILSVQLAKVANSINIHIRTPKSLSLISIKAVKDD